MADSMLVYVVDDDQAMRESLGFLLDSAGFSVRLYESARSLLDGLLEVPIGCLLTDIRMPDIDGLELLRRVRQMERPLPVILMTAHGDVPLAVEAMRLGARDFLEKPFEDEALISALRSALEEAEANALPDAALADFKARLGSLSQRERQVLEGLIAGEANKVMALSLAISPRTVEIYRAKLMSKMQAGSVSELIRLSVRAGIA